MEKLTFAWLWLGAHRRKILNPFAKAMVVFFMVLLVLFPCPFKVTGTGLFVAAALLITFCTAVYIILSLNDHKVWLALFIALQVAGCIALTMVAYSYCYKEREIVRGVSLGEVHEYGKGSFILTDGQAVVNYTALLSFSGENIMMAPLVPSLAAWNISMPIYAWAFASVPPWDDGTEKRQQWSDPGLHEGSLNTDHSADEGIKLMQAEYPQLRVANNSFIMTWGRLEQDLTFLRDMMIIVNVVVFVVYLLAVVVWALDYYKFHWLSSSAADEDAENLYLLKKDNNFYNYNSSDPY